MRPALPLLVWWSSREKHWRHSLEAVAEILLDDADVDAIDRPPLHGAREELAADGRQHRIGQDRIDHAAAALELGAALGDQLHHLVIEGERDLVRGLDALLEI